MEFINLVEIRDRLEEWFDSMPLTQEALREYGLD